MKFIEQDLQTQITRNFLIDGKLSNLNLNELYTMHDGSKLNLIIANGTQNNKDTVVWQTALAKEKIFTIAEIKHWMSFAHDTISPIFRTMLSKEFYDSLR